MSVSSHLNKILIANRGEIACRIISTAKRLGVKTVAVYSDADINAKHVEMADEAFHIGPSSAQESYLKGDKIVDIALKTGTKGIHPGYGFLSENVEFATKCQESGVIFIGPPASAIRDMGIKSTSKKIMSEAGVDIVPGYHGEDQSEARLVEEARRIGFPLMIKAVRGGGGKGMRVVRKESEFLSGLESARRESLRAFGDEDVLLEKYLERPRHIEVQIFGDNFGNHVHLFERDCSIQRRHQKVIEQAPAPGISDAVRQNLGETAVRAAKAVYYVGAGTVEFIFDTQFNKFYFMEMNTRLQVEHPVTEMITGLDLVAWQLEVAAGLPLPLRQEQVRLRGAAVEARIYAEGRDFIPVAGHIQGLSLPSGQHVRVDTGVTSGDDVSVHYDPMIAKLIVWDEHKENIFWKLENALSDFNIVGVENNVDFLRSLCKNEKLIEGNLHTGFIEENKAEIAPSSPSEHIIFQAALYLVLTEEADLKQKAKTNFEMNNPFSTLGPFRVNHYHTRTVKFKDHHDSSLTHTVHISYMGENVYILQANNFEKTKCTAEIISKDGILFNLKLATENNVFSSKMSIANDTVYIFNDTGDYKLILVDERRGEREESEDRDQMKEAVSPMPGVVEKVTVRPGDSVKEGDIVAVVIAMKMEHTIKAAKDGKVAAVMYKPGDSVGKDVPIITFEG